MQPTTEAIIYLAGIVVSLFSLALLLRFLLQLTQTNFFNPIAQTIVKITNPVLKPTHRFIPSTQYLNFPAITVVILIKILWAMLIFSLASPSYPAFHQLIAWAMISTLSSILSIFFFAVIILAIASWIAPHSHHPGLVLIKELCQPLLIRIQRLIPPLGGLDFSLFFVLIAIQLLNILLIKPLSIYTNLPPGLFPW